MNIEEKKKKFTEEIRLHSDKYERELLNNFYKYWTQVEQVSGKMRFEKQKTFFIKKRLFTFKKLSEKYSKKNTAINYINTANELINEARERHSSGT